MRKIKNFTKSALRAGAHFAVMTDFSNRAFKLTTDNDSVKTVYKQLSEAIEAEDKAFKLPLKWEQTAEIAVNDYERCRLYKLLKKAAYVWTDINDATKSAAAARIKESILLYKFDARTQYDNKTGYLQSLLQDLSEADVEALSLTALVEAMTQANNKVKQLIASRTDERSKREKAALSKARKATDEAYSLVVDTINALACLDDTGKFDAFITQWNEEIVRIKQRIIDDRAKKEDEEPTDTDSEAMEQVEKTDETSENEENNENKETHVDRA